ncbi:hypothetical protein C7M22_03538 [Bacillus velezensis]|uniref:hypothetical protein n=1 Tax=Bacillus amyloliquefaciens TaxID=1390 RepID=UPI0006243C4A|nr:MULTISPECIES: hypothetical protein [Bacillus amyloliquefaciens group]AKF30918.1 hypothetical protein AAV29_10285 [Bacillus velezensis]QHK65580.1 hypothetical protein C7M22_03538 [Bacillus velezensis]QHL98686.1 hypothetical protein C7M25_02912 [Bacillus velezensis]GLZ63317.1 hypothetical protein Bamy02_03700 [Bacillus amyloliquefaciens]
MVIAEEYKTIQILFNKMERQMGTVKEALENKEYERAHRNLINLSDNNEELMQEIRWTRKGIKI